MFLPNSFLVLSVLLQSISAFTVELQEKTSYAIYSGVEPRMDAKSAVKAAWDDMMTKDQTKFVAMMACATIEDSTYCASSSLLKSTPARKVNLEELQPGTKVVLEDCKRSHENTPHKSHRCAEIFLLDLIVRKGIDPMGHKATVYAYGRGRSKDPKDAKYHDACDSTKEGTGCRQLLETLKWDSSPPVASRATSPERSGSRSSSRHRRDLHDSVYIRDLIDMALEEDILWARDFETDFDILRARDSLSDFEFDVDFFY